MKVTTKKVTKPRYRVEMHLYGPESWKAMQIYTVWTGDDGEVAYRIATAMQERDGYDDERGAKYFYDVPNNPPYPQKV